jgi:hypothetical protein
MSPCPKYQYNVDFFLRFTRFFFRQIAKETPGFKIKPIACAEMDFQNVNISFLWKYSIILSNMELFGKWILKMSIFYFY